MAAKSKSWLVVMYTSLKHVFVSNDRMKYYLNLIYG